MSSLENPVIPKGSLVLVTGANGFVGSHVADQFLEHGYNVRGTVRNTGKNAWLTEYFDKSHGPGRFELVKVEDMAADGAFDEAVKGVAAVAHTSSIMSFSPDPHDVIPGSITGAINALKAAFGESCVKRFVFTSSSSAAVRSDQGKPGITVTEDTWNEDDVKLAWADPPYEPDRSIATYAASKTQTEQAVWKFYRENREKRPDLVVNTVLPNFVLGKVLDVAHQGYPSSADLCAGLYRGDIGPIYHLVDPQYFVDAEDVGRLHVAAVILPHVKDQRIFGFAERFNFDAILEIFRKHEPNKKFPDNFQGGRDPNEIEPRGKAEQLLRDLGRNGWTSLEESVLNNVRELREATSKA